jgi:hypothetical protein
LPSMGLVFLRCTVQSDIYARNNDYETNTLES